MKILTLPVFLAAAALALPAHAELSKADVEAIVKETLNNNPEIVVDSFKKFQEKKQAEEALKSKAALKDKAKDLKDSKTSPVAGNPKGDVTVVEFFDYHCGYCKKVVPTVTKIIKDDPKVKVVFKELPILSEDSNLAAKAALAVFKIKPEKYFDFHTALMSASGKFDAALLAAEAKKLGIEEDKLKKEMESASVADELKKNRELAEAVGVRGTPGFVVGDTMIPGAASEEDLKKLIDETRKGKK